MILKMLNLNIQDVSLLSDEDLRVIVLSRILIDYIRVFATKADKGRRKLRTQFPSTCIRVTFYQGIRRGESKARRLLTTMPAKDYKYM